MTDRTHDDDLPSGGLIAVGQYVGDWPPGSGRRSIRVGHRFIPITAPQLRVWRAVAAPPVGLLELLLPGDVGRPDVDAIAKACAHEGKWEPAIGPDAVRGHLAELLASGALHPMPRTPDERAAFARTWRAVPQLNAFGLPLESGRRGLYVTAATGRADVALEPDAFEYWAWLGVDRDLAHTAARDGCGGPTFRLGAAADEVAAAMSEGARAYLDPADADADDDSISEALHVVLELIRHGAAHLDLADPGPRPEQPGPGAAEPEHEGVFVAVRPAKRLFGRGRGEPDPSLYPIGQALGQWRTNVYPQRATYRVRVGPIAYELSHPEYELWRRLRYLNKESEIERYGREEGIAEARTHLRTLVRHGLLLRTAPWSSGLPAALRTLTLRPTLSSVDSRGEPGWHGIRLSPTLGPRGLMREILLLSPLEPDLAATLDAVAQRLARDGHALSGFSPDHLPDWTMYQLSHDLHGELAFLDLAPPRPAPGPSGGRPGAG